MFGFGVILSTLKNDFNIVSSILSFLDSFNAILEVYTKLSADPIGLGGIQRRYVVFT